MVIDVGARFALKGNLITDLLHLRSIPIVHPHSSYDLLIVSALKMNFPFFLVKCDDFPCHADYLFVIFLVSSVRILRVELRNLDGCHYEVWLREIRHSLILIW